MIQELTSFKEPNMLMTRERILLLLAIFSYFDLLFLPYFQLLILPYSLPIVMVGIFLLKKAYFPPHTKLLFFLLVLLMCVSVIIGTLLPSSAPYASENIKRVLQFSTSFLYLIFFFSVAQQLPIVKMLMGISLCFLCYFLFWNVRFIFEPAVVNSLMTNYYGRLVTAEDVALEHFRFSYMFSDPNTAGYFVLIAVMPWLMFYRAVYTRLVIFTLCLIVAMLIQSRGALSGVILGFIVAAIPRRWLVLKLRLHDFSNLYKGILFATIIASLSITVLVIYLGELPIFEMGLERVSEAESYSTGGSRFEIWSLYMSHLTAFPLGRGYQFNVPFGYGQFYPHSDVLRFLYSYGFIAMFLLLFFFIRTSWKFPLLFMPAFIALSINTLLDEQKMFALFLASLGVLMASKRSSHLGSN